MRTFLVSILLVTMMVAAASAELLTTANPIGKGGWAIMGAGVQDQNVSNNSSYNMTTLGGYVGYGITDKLDAYIQAGSSTVGGLPTSFGIQVKGALTSIGLTAKYTLMDEAAGSPVSVALGAGYRTLNTTMTIPGANPTPPPAIIAVDSTTSGNQTMIGVGVSKIIVPFVPYAGLAYRSTTQSGNAVSTQMDLTIGTAIAWSMQGAVFAEYTMQSITPNGGSAYSSGQIGVGVGYKI